MAAACDAEFLVTASPARKAALLKERARQLMALGEKDAAAAAIASAAESDVQHQERKATAHVDQGEIRDAAAAWERTFSLLRSEPDAPRAELRRVEKCVRNARKRLASVPCDDAAVAGARE